MTTGPQSRSATELLGNVLMHMTQMAKGEIALAQAELGEKLLATGKGLAMAGVALMLVPALVGLIFTTLILGLIALGLKPVWVALAVTCAVALLIAVLLAMAKNLLRWGDLSASRTMQSLRRDAQTLKEIVTNDTSV